MSDLELLMLAAKAAGMLPVKEGKELDYTRSGGLAFCGLGEYVQWNPLADDGDALRLAVKLGIDIEFLGIIERWELRPPETHASIMNFHPIVRHGDDALAATRRAIVLAAAAYGTLE